MGSGGSTTTVPKRGPEPEELINIRKGLYNTILPGMETFSPDDWNVARKTAQNAVAQQGNLLREMPNALSANNFLGYELAHFARTGSVPKTITDNLNASVNNELRSGMGSMLNNLASRGVINSSITSQGVNDLSRQAADAYNRNYMNAYQSVLGGLSSALQGQQTNTSNLLSTINAIGKIPEQAYEGVAAQIMPAFNFWKAWQNSYDGREDYDTIVQQGK